MGKKISKGACCYSLLPEGHQPLLPTLIVTSVADLWYFLAQLNNVANADCLRIIAK
jgi:hypothetical protein